MILEDVFMRRKNARTLELIVKHQEYFDQKLIDMVTELNTTIKNISEEKTRVKCQNEQLIFTNQSLNIKLNDLKSQNSILKIQCAKEKAEKDDLLKEVQRIQDELEKLQRETELQRIEIEKQRKEIERQEKTIDKYKYINSTNSNMPSSFDVLSHTKAKASANTRVPTNRKRGGQKYHKLHKSQIKTEVHSIICKNVVKAPHGAKPIKDEKDNILYYVTHEVDLILKSEIIETRYYISEDGEVLDDKTMKKYAINPLTYSHHFKASVVYLNQRGTVPLQRLSEMMSDISRGTIQLQPSTISKWCQECHIKSREIQERILDDILHEHVCHVDETGIKISGENRWIHVITNDKGAYFICTENRGEKEGGTISLLDLYTGVLVHDHFKTYQKLLLCKHAECNAHIDRYLKSGIDFDKNEECQKLLELMHEILHRKHTLIDEGKSSMEADEITGYEKRYEEIIKNGLKKYDESNPNVSKKIEPDYIKTLRRMLEFKEEHLRFMKDFTVPYTNNKAEKMCRVVKAHKNISQQFVTIRGGEAYASIISIIQTANIRKENALEKLDEIFSN